MRDEIGPAIALLLDRADAHVERQGRRIDALKARSELQQGRLQGHRDKQPERPKSGKSGTGGAGRRGGGGTGDAEARLRARALRQRKEALKYSVERLELEVLQKERELRKRLESAAS